MAGSRKTRVSWLPPRLAKWHSKMTKQNAQRSLPRHGKLGKPLPWQVHEAEVARLLGGRRIPQSGAGPEKGDVIVESTRLLVECKFTEAASRAVTRTELQKCADEAGSADCVPVLALRFAEGFENYDYVIVPLAHYADLLGK